MENLLLGNVIESGNISPFSCPFCGYNGSLGISIIHSKEEVQTDYDLVVQLVNHNVFNEMGFADAAFIKLKDLL